MCLNIESALYIKLRYGNDEPFMLAPLTLDVSRVIGNVVRLSDEYMYDSGYSPTYRAISGPLVKSLPPAVQIIRLRRTVITLIMYIYQKT